MGTALSKIRARRGFLSPAAAQQKLAQGPPPSQAAAQPASPLNDPGHPSTAPICRAPRAARTAAQARAANTI